MKDKLEEARKVLQEEEKKKENAFVKELENLLKKHQRRISIQNVLTFPRK